MSRPTEAIATTAKQQQLLRRGSWAGARGFHADDPEPLHLLAAITQQHASTHRRIELWVSKAQAASGHLVKDVTWSQHRRECSQGVEL